MKSSLALECNHNFHKKCIFEWNKIKNTCPICRSAIKFKGYCLGIYKKGKRKGQYCCSLPSPGELYCKKHALELNIKIKFDINEDCTLVRELIELTNKQLVWSCVCDINKMTHETLSTSPVTLEINLHNFYNIIQS